MALIRNLLSLVLVSGVAILGDAAGAYAQQRIALQSGESAVLRNYFYITNCRSIMVGQPQLDILEGPEEITVELKEGPVLPRAQRCPSTVPGGTVVATAKNVDEPKMTRLTIRLKFNTKSGERQTSDTYLVSLFPGKSPVRGLVPSTPSMNSTGSAVPTSPQ
jgi:hypothetical protein